jgi:hypothetical protein
VSFVLADEGNIWFVKGVNFVFAVLFLKQELSGLVENGRKDFCKIFSDFSFHIANYSANNCFEMLIDLLALDLFSVKIARDFAKKAFGRCCKSSNNTLIDFL